MTPALPLAALGLIDAAFSGFRAYAGRDARIRKHRAVLRASLRGLAVGSALLLVPILTACAVLLTATDQSRAYDRLVDGGTAYLLCIAAYALAVALSLAAYFVLPFRASTLAMVIGLGPLTLLRPLVLAAGCTVALAAGGWPSLLVSATAGAAALATEQIVHRRWYSRPL
ncbi:hypothetical protein [Actinomadura parmotrematis]|uniref:Uncharacterized protein n=1 Tax=Actinomadura parmotrematis TaxID=2864039 RepID=A0ABS7G0B2_9ACTN|nr:hypothetical protein [Actinomadura parmotrematis]MBW8485262.1 hypothetical protein [Actinomadura parmotrematis]